ncbi:MAG: hypothetical protein PHE09_02430 [Oscillospiraceae bacterium]|nr:hypothetical protein [Oscillospiraceae bacterium]
MKINKPLGYYTDDSSLRFHVLSVGEGLMVLIVFSNNKVMLFDCNVTTENEEEIIQYLANNIPFNYNADTDKNEQLIHVFVNSHRDEDHYRGLKIVNSKFKVQSIWDSGQTGATTQSDDYKYYMGLRRRLSEKNVNALKVLAPTNIPIATVDGAEIYCFAAEQGFTPECENGIIFEAATKIQHTNSIVLQVKYGGTSLLLTGDSDWISWRDKIIPNYRNSVKSSILIASHHGSRSFFTDEANETIDIDKCPDTTYLDSIDYISPDITLISCGKYDTYHHPNKDAMKIYREKNKNDQVYSTHSQGHLLGYINSVGHYTVVPSRFCEWRTAAYSFDMQIECTYKVGNSSISVANGDRLSVGGDLYFAIKTKGGIIEPIEKVCVWWEVSNGGINAHKSHQEIYFKGKSEEYDKFRFVRSLSFCGTHLLRCHIKNTTKGSITRIFKVIGI